MLMKNLKLKTDHLEKSGLFCYSENGFRSSPSTADFLTIATDRIARAFIRSAGLLEL